MKSLIPSSMDETERKLDELYDLISKGLSKSFDFKEKALEALRSLNHGEENINRLLRRSETKAMRTNMVTMKHFLTDTEKFILQGRRDIGINVWCDSLLTSYEGSIPTSRISFKLTCINVGSDALVHRWCSQSDGLSDIICTTRILVKFLKGS